jgi:alpha-beta hydrolase superfamily lysophospholipase
LTEQGPVRVPKDVLEDLEALRRDARTDALDIPMLRYAASEGGRPALVVWLDRHPSEYGRGLLDGFEAED